MREEQAGAEKEARRKEAEEFGLFLGGADGDERESVYYHYASQGDKTQDFMWWMRQALRERLGREGHAVTADEWRPSNGYPARSACVRVGDFDPPPTSDEAPSDARGLLEGTCTIRAAKGRRALFLDLTIEVPWRCYIDEGTERERSLGGKTRLWNITHFNEVHEWQHLNHRNTHETGPASEAMAERLPPALAARLKVAVQEVLLQLMSSRIDPSEFLPPPKPKPSSRGWGKGTVDYSKWDALDDSDDDDERVVEIER